MISLQHKFTLAQQLLVKARTLLRGRAGVTIIVHDQNLHPGATDIALVTTLPDRKHTRALIAECLFQSAFADGFNSENAHEQAIADYRSVMETPPDPEPPPSHGGEVVHFQWTDVCREKPEESP